MNASSTQAILFAMSDREAARSVAGSCRSTASPPVARRAGVALLLLVAGASVTVPAFAGPPDRALNLQVPYATSPLAPPPVPGTAPPPAPKFQPAPLPNRGVELTPPRASNDPRLAPNLFTRPDQYRGDGFNKGSTVQSEEDKRVKPGAGFSLHMPLTPN